LVCWRRGDGAEFFSGKGSFRELKNRLFLIKRRFLIIFESIVRVKTNDSLEEFAVFVSGLTFSVTEHPLREVFGKMGKVTNAQIARNKDMHSLCWGVVFYADESGVERAIQSMDGGQLDGCVLTVRKAISPRFNYLNSLTFPPLNTFQLFPLLHSSLHHLIPPINHSHNYRSALGSTSMNNPFTEMVSDDHFSFSETTAATTVARSFLGRLSIAVKCD
jgi:RNA recognition motif-containing protein